MNYRNISDLNNTILRNLSLIPSDIDCIVAIPRSGIIPAILISLYKNLPFYELHSFVSGQICGGGERLKTYNLESYNKILVVDDSLWSGNSLSNAKEELAKVKLSYEYIYAAIYVKPGSEKLIDISFELLDIPRVFQWNLFHHYLLKNACLDLDGVLCVDPRDDENDDGENYLNFLTAAKPLYIPTVEINTIVSCRLEKYRQLTEAWLHSHNIKFNNLILLDLPDKDARTKWNKYGEFKAEIYEKSTCCLFIESSLQQAKIISNLTNKAVICTENFELIKSNVIFQKPSSFFLNKLIKRLKLKLKRIYLRFNSFLKLLINQILICKIENLKGYKIH